MHGAVNQAVEDLIISKYDEATWLKIKKKSGFTEEMFLSNEPYPDQLTFDLVIATNAITKLPVDQILIALGEHWVLETGMKKYGALLRSGGQGFEEFVKYLPKFHGRVMMVYPNIIPPEFDITVVSANELILHYHSKRDGLTKFVYGLIQGISKMFDHPVEIEIRDEKLKGKNHDTFYIKY
jgi:hypothetical protein